VAEQLRRAVLAAYDRLFGLELEHLVVDGASPRRLRRAGRRAQSGGSSQAGLKRSVATEASGIPLAAVPAPANHRDDGLLAATLTPSGCSARCLSGPPCIWTPATTGSRVGRSGASGAWQRDRHPWQARAGPDQPPLAGGAHPCLANQDGKLRWCTERRRLVVESWLALVNAVIVCGRLVRRAWTCYRWDSRPRRRP
jgi:hypothetical protein